MKRISRVQGCLFAAAGCATSVVIALVLTVVFLRATFVKNVQLGISMEPTIAKGDLFVSRKAGEIARGDIVVFKMPKDGIAAFRVVALPGETVALRGGKAIVNGAFLHEPYVELREGPEPQIPVLRDMSEVRVPPDHYFLLGDNRDHANDSRFIGFVKRSDIYRRVVLRISETEGVRWL